MKVPGDECAISGPCAISSSENRKSDSGSASEIRDLLESFISRPGGEDKGSRTSVPGISEVLPSLYLSGAGIIIPLILDKLSIKCVISAAPELPDTPLPDSTPLYLKVEIIDRADSNLKEHFNEVADLIHEVRESGGKTLVHCVAGVSRSASLCIAYLVKHMGMSLREAYHHVRSARPQIRPNVGFFRQLIDFEKEIRGTASVQMVFKDCIGAEIPDVYEAEYRAMEEYYQRRQNGRRR